MLSPGPNSHLYTSHILTAVSKACAIGVTVAIATVNSACLSHWPELPLAETRVKFSFSTGLS